MTTTIRQKGEFKNIFTVIAALFPARARSESDRALFIETFSFPSCVNTKLAQTHPKLREQDIALVLRALRDWFQVCLAARGRYVSMPSTVVDDAWHAFILDTRAYEQFCEQAFGRFLHHRPAQPYDAVAHSNKGLEPARKHAAQREGQDPADVLELPLLFGIDAQLGIDKRTLLQSGLD